MNLQVKLRFLFGKKQRSLYSNDRNDILGKLLRETNFNRQVKTLALIFILFISLHVAAQVGIGTTTPNATSQLDISSTTKGALMPRMTAAQKNAIASPATGLLVYQTDQNSGFYFFNGVSWNNLTDATPGDIKQGMENGDHGGWIKLDGRLKSSLTASQQATATSLGIGTSLPDASNSFLVQNGNALGTVSGSNSKTIVQANLPNITLTGGTAASAGDHNHAVSIRTNDGGYPVSAPSAFHYGGGTGPGSQQATSDRGGTSTSNSGLIVNAGAHTHTVSIPLGGSGTALDITPKSLSVNTYIYLGY